MFNIEHYKVSFNDTFIFDLQNECVHFSPEAQIIINIALYKNSI